MQGYGFAITVLGVLAYYLWIVLRQQIEVMKKIKSLHGNLNYAVLYAGLSWKSSARYSRELSAPQRIVDLALTIAFPRASIEF